MLYNEEAFTDVHLIARDASDLPDKMIEHCDDIDTGGKSNEQSVGSASEDDRSSEMNTAPIFSNDLFVGPARCCA